MEYRTIGRTGPRVSRICLGTNNFGRQLDAAKSKAVISKAIDLGVNVIDTANIYTGGRSEEIIGEAIRGNRSQVLIATKVGMAVAEGPGMTGLSRRHIEWQIGESLKRLRTDYVDIYYMHRFDPETPLEETLSTLDALVKQGKVRFVGASNFTPEQLDEAMKVCERLDLAIPAVVQPEYNMLSRDPEAGLFPYCAARGLGVFTYSPLLGGFLTGKYAKGSAPPPGSRAQANPRYWERLTSRGDFLTLDRLRAVADRAAIPLGELAIAWILRNPAVTAPIVGASTPEQVAQNCEVPRMKAPDAVFAELDGVLGA